MNVVRVTNRLASPAEAEQQRRKLQADLDSILTSDERNRLGQYATPSELAWDIMALAAKKLQSHARVRFLDPGVGSGVFFSALIDTISPDRIGQAVGFEVDETFVKLARDLWLPWGLQVHSGDFTQTAAPVEEADKFDLIVCNPPYSRHHHLGSDIKARLKERVREQLSLRINGLAGLYCYFMLLADAWLASGGTGLWLVPAEFLDVDYGAVLRQYLSISVQLRRIHRYDSEDLQFADALVSSSVVMFEKVAPSGNHTVTLTSGGTLLKPKRTFEVPLSVLRQRQKWGELTRRGNKRQRGAGAEETTFYLGDFFSVKRGLATGANKFFILKRAQAEALGLPTEFLQPILPSPRYLRKYYIEADESGWPKLQNQLALVNCTISRADVRGTYPALDRYFSEGEEAGLPNRYLLSKRTPWYKQEERPPAPIVCTYMGRKSDPGRTFRFFRNDSRATAPNVYLMLYPNRTLQTLEVEQPGFIDRIFRMLERISNETYEAQGRTYGGGLNKLEPKELAGLRLPLDLQGNAGLKL